jgi:hypothetical protein
VAVEHEPAAAPAPPVVAASPEVVGGAPLGAETVLSLQRTAGNQAVCRAIATGQIARAPTQVGVTGVTVSPAKFTAPLEAGVSVRAVAAPANATGVTWALKDGTAAVTGSSIDAKGAIAVGAAQPGGTLEAEATADDGSSFSMPFNVVSKPTAIASTAAAASGSYSGTFTHTLAPGAATQGGNINEKFDSLSVDTDFGKFTLSANAAGSQGWDLDAAGTMAGPDNVSIDKAGVDATKFVKNASNPSPAKSPPVGFSMTQHLFAKSFPSGRLDAAEFASTPHVRNLEDRSGLKVVLKAGKGEVAIPYEGPAVYRDAKADKTSVEASAPKPAAGDWKRNEVQVSVTAEPAGSSVRYAFTGDALACEIDASSGKVLVGDKAGTIKVRAGDGAKSYDEVSITITARPAATATPKSDSGGAGAEPMAVPAGMP